MNPISKKWNVVIAILAILAVISVALCIYTTIFPKLPEIDVSRAQLVLYEGPKPISPSTAVTMKADGNNLFVYDATVNNDHNGNWTTSTTPLTSFDFEGAPVNMEITLNDQTNPENVIVRPLGKNITPKVSGNVISFQISEPDVYTVEYGGKAETAMHIFANEIDRSAPTASSDKVMYIGPGAWNIDVLQLKNDTQLYISGGAVIQGVIVGNGVSGATVSGHGFLSGSHHDSWITCGTAYVPINLSGCKDIAVEGVSLLDSNAWCLNIYDCQNVDVENVKIISARANGDGITIQSSQDISVSDCFVRSWDDSLVVKNYSGEQGSDSARISFKDCQIWTDLAQSMEIGYETNKGSKVNAEIFDISFKDITVLHNFHKPVISIHNADECRVHGISYENIIVEDASMGNGDAKKNAQLIDFNTFPNENWSSTSERGTIDTVSVNGVYVLDGNDKADYIEGNLCPIRIHGYGETAVCTDITVANVYILGKGLTDENVKNNPSTELLRIENVHFVCDREMPAELASLIAK